MIFTFPKFVNKFLSQYSKHDYSVLNTRLFMSCWLSFALDSSVQSMRGLFRKINLGGKPINQSTFSKAISHRSTTPFQELYKSLNQLIKERHQPKSEWDICPIDSTTITLTSKLLWSLGHHQVKLFNAISHERGSCESCIINFGSDHDYKFATSITASLSSNQVAVMDRGFAALKYFKELSDKKIQFVIRITRNYKREMKENGLWEVGSGKAVGLYRLVWFSDIETKTEYCLITSLPESVSNYEIAEIYRLRWEIELFWKFLKMHLKLDRLISKSENGIQLQLYACLCAYLILQILEIPEIWGCNLLDKLRYIQAQMTQEYSFVHWIERILENRPLRLHFST